VFVVGEGSVAQARVVTLGPVVAAGQVVVDGLAAGERVVVNGQVALRDGAAVNVQEPGDGSR
jgi:membrane fusion protein (multidrug efflux system)